MTEEQQPVPKWILIVSGIFALLELMVSFTLWFSPESVLDTVDLTAKGVDYLVYMWAVRQFALGFIFGYGTYKRSAQMLSIAYIFFLVMMIGDLVIGVLQKNNALIISALIMGIVASALLVSINRKKRM